MGSCRAGVSMHIYESLALLARFGRSSSGRFYAYLRITGSALSSWEMVERAFPCVFTCHRTRPLESGNHRSGVSMRIYVSPAQPEFVNRAFSCVCTCNRRCLLEWESRRAGVSMHIYVSLARVARARKSSNGRFDAYLRENGFNSDLKSAQKYPGTHPETKWFNLGFKCRVLR